MSEAWKIREVIKHFEDGHTELDRTEIVAGRNHVADVIDDQYAHLIAAGPQMLAALNKIVTHWNDLHPKDLAQARAAIAAAGDAR